MKTLKVILVICFSSLFFGAALMPGSSMSDFFRMPALFQHYEYTVEHENADISFTEYLQMHFSASKHNVNTAQHQNLPFHESSQGQSQVLLYLHANTPLINQIDISKPLFYKFNQKAPPLHIEYSIFHPPIA